MKTIYWLILGALAATSVTAQDTNSLPPTPAPAIAPAGQAVPATAETNLPPKAVRKSHAIAPKRTPFVEPPVTLMPGAAEVAAPNLNVRGQAGLKGEFITHISKGQTVTVLQQINLDKHKANEPAQWAKIAFPTNGQVWVLSKFIDANKTVAPKKLNLRAGPGENYSVIGMVEHGTPVTEITSKGQWTRIEPPQNAYAFVAAMYLKQDASGTIAANIPPSTETEPTTTAAVGDAPIIVTQPTTTDPTMPSITDTNLAMVETNLPPPPPRVVTHEGTVRHVRSVIEPTAYELFDLKTGTDINYLYTTSTNLDISRYNGMHIVVTGTEGLAERWPRTPVLTIDKIMVVE